MDHPDPCYCGEAHCGACGDELDVEKSPPYAGPGLFDERWVCKTCAESFSKMGR